MLWIDEFLKQLGYGRDGRLHVYWCRPWKTIADGLQCIESDSDILDMIATTKEAKTLSLLIDHTNFLRGTEG